MIPELSKNIWDTCIFRPTLNEIKPFEEMIQSIDIKEFIIYNFITYQSTGLTQLLLSTFRFWKTLPLKDWLSIFDAIMGNNLAEYYMTVFSAQYLGIDPKFESAKSVQISYVTLSNMEIQGAKPSLFIDDMHGQLRDTHVGWLSELFNLSIDDFVQLARRLQNEIH